MQGNHYILLNIVLMLCMVPAWCQSSETYAEKLGWKKGDRVVILHVDDAGMSYDSNQGAIQAIEKGVANSVSVMMPCPWVPGFVKYLKSHPQVDAGLHLTLTSEWQDYRWGPLTGKPASPGLVDQEGALWHSVQEVVQHASADEVEKEIVAQLNRARQMGFEPTHLDSHMGTLFATPAFMQRYIKVGIENKIPVMFPGGHNWALVQQMQEETKAELKKVGKWQEGQQLPEPDLIKLARETGKMIWDAGLPVLDDLHNTSYGWNLPAQEKPTDENLRKMKTEKYIQALKSLKPGVTMVIMHCTAPTEVFKYISSSGNTRKGDLLAMLDPALKKTIEQEGIILTTWRELKQRRDKAMQTSGK
jgi:chitin disaccharide deacetylase